MPSVKKERPSERDFARVSNWRSRAGEVGGAGGQPAQPVYIRGKTGVVIGIHGRIDNPVDHRGIYPPLYTVEFEVREVFGTASADRLAVDIHDDWLEAP
jgi:hypothetical protein